MSDDLREPGRVLDVLIATEVMGYVRPKGRQFTIPAYSQDIGAAGQVLVKMRQWMVEHYGERVETKLVETVCGGWWCSFIALNEELPIGLGNHTTLPVAVCRAAIDAITGASRKAVATI